MRDVTHRVEEVVAVEDAPLLLSADEQEARERAGADDAGLGLGPRLLGAERARRRLEHAELVARRLRLIAPSLRFTLVHFSATTSVYNP